MKITRRNLHLVLAIPIAALALSACGESESAGESDGESATSAESVAVSEIDGQEVLVDAEGRALYTAVQEADGEIACTDGCLTVWDPVLASEGGSASSELGGQLDEVARPDGGRQLALDGAPLYRFLEEEPGELTGEGLVDEFDGVEFEWEAATAGEAAAETDESAPSQDVSPGLYGSGY